MPSSYWSVMRLEEFLTPVRKPVDVEPVKLYVQIGIKSHGKGIFYKEPVTGTALGKKNVFWVEPNCFVLNIVFAWEQAIAKTTESERGMIASHRFPMFQANESKVDLDYLIAYLLTKRGTEILKMVSPGGAGRNKTLSQEAFLKCKIPLPPLAEQKKIAAILSTQDRVIELKERRLEEKRRQKNCLMQRVLHGKWPVITLHELVIPLSEQVGDKKIEVLSISANIGFVNQSEKFGKDISGKQYSKYIVIHKGDFAYNKGNSKSYPQGCIYPLEDRETGAVPNVFIPFRLKHGHDYRFFKYLFESGYLNAQLYKRINSGVRDDGLLNLKDEEFFKCLIPVPPVKEQIQIANILSAADRELSLLRADLEQERQKKKALMQLLLSGLVRVNAKGGEADGAV